MVSGTNGAIQGHSRGDKDVSDGTIWLVSGMEDDVMVLICTVLT